MTSDIQIAHLRTLIAIAEEGGFEGAAIRVGRTQSAVTQQMHKLEETVGKPLFRAKGRRRELTQAGLTMVRYGQEIVSMSRHALAATVQASDGGLVRLGVPHEIADDVLPEALRRFAARWPDIRVVVHAERSPTLMSMLQENRLEAAITTRRSQLYHGSIIRSLQTYWVAAPGFRWDQTMPLPLVLTDEPSLFRRITLSALELGDIPYIERFTSPSLAGLRPAVYGGLGMTARTKPSFSEHVSLFGEADGLPPLPKVNYYGYVHSAKAPGYVHDLMRCIKGEEHVAAAPG